MNTHCALSKCRFCLLLLFLLYIGTGNACGQKTTERTAGQQFVLDEVSDSLYILRIGESKWEIPFPVYRFETGDVNGDGKTDAILGVVKSTKFDPVVRRRIFIFKNYYGNVRPLWLGSRFGAPVIDFHFMPEDGILRVAGRNDNGKCVVTDLEWESFGMDFVRYVEEDCTEERALELLYNTPEEDNTGK